MLEGRGGGCVQLLGEIQQINLIGLFELRSIEGKSSQKYEETWMLCHHDLDRKPKVTNFKKGLSQYGNQSFSENCVKIGAFVWRFFFFHGQTNSQAN